MIKRFSTSSELTLPILLVRSGVPKLFEKRAVAYAGFSKGRGQENQKIFSLKISPFSCPKSGEDQNKIKKKGFHSNLVRFLA